MSRWAAAGDGRADVRIHGGDLDDEPVTVTECWDQDFLRVYYEDSLGIEPAEGTVAACVFS